MTDAPAHPWRVTTAQARAIQERLRSRVRTADRIGRVRFVAGVDVGFDKPSGTTHAAVAVLGYPDLEPVEQATAVRPTDFPYIPGYLSFREIPAILDAMERLRRQPDLLLCDGHGLAHPRRFGIACHLGVLTARPSIGVAKSRLVGAHAPVPDRKGAWAPLVDGAETIGAVLRTRAGVKPIYVSIGHRLSLSTAIELVMGCVTRFRLPETTRAADRLASRRG